MSSVPWRCKRRAGDQPETSRLCSLRGELDRLFEQYVREPLGSIEWPFGQESGWIPAVDVCHDQDEVVVRVELPGVDSKDIEVTLAGNSLAIFGEKPEPADKCTKDVLQRELRFGPFRRSVALPDRVDADDVEARFADGVLVLRLKKTQPSPPKRIEIGAHCGGAASPCASQPPEAM